MMEFLTLKTLSKNHSEDVSKNNGGLLINSQTGSSLFTIDQLSPNIRYLVEKMNEGDMSSISQYVMSDGMKYRIIKINRKIDEHRANLVDDFSQINDLALNTKKQNKISEWIEHKISNTYIRLTEDITDCETLKKWKK